MRWLVAFLSVVAAVVALILLANWFIGGGLLSPPHESWVIGVRPDARGSWELSVPAIVVGDGDEAGAAALEDLYRSMAVVDGNATYERTATSLVIRGDGGAVLIAGRTGRLGSGAAFGSWTAADLNVTRLDADGPSTEIQWIVDLDGGKGHSCWAQAEWTFHILAGETKLLTEGGHLNAPGRPWNTACA